MTTNLSPLEQKLWDDWIIYQDHKAANELIRNYMYLVNFHVERVASHLPANVDKEDLRSYGMFGLFDALKKFDTKRKLKFDTYASFRIRGAIIDGLRKEDWVPRSMREKMKKIDKISEKLEQKYQREPTVEEIAVCAGIPTDEVETIVRDSLFSIVLSIDDQLDSGTNEHKESVGYSIPDKHTPQPDEKMVQNELKHDLIKGIQTLNENEQLIISLFYHDELTLTEIGKILGLTTSRISQIHKKAIFKLRKTLKKVIDFT